VSGLLGGSVHLLQDLLGEGLLDLVDVGVTTSGPDTSSLGLGELLDVSVHGVLSMDCQQELFQHVAQRADLSGRVDRGGTNVNNGDSGTRHDDGVDE